MLQSINGLRTSCVCILCPLSLYVFLFHIHLILWLSCHPDNTCNHLVKIHDVVLVLSSYRLALASLMLFPEREKGESMRECADTTCSLTIHRLQIIAKKCPQ